MKIKIIHLVMLALLLNSSVYADVYVPGYQRQNGTSVAPHYRSDPNNTTQDNWSTRGNYNPHTGQEGTRNPQQGYSGMFGRSN